MWKSIRIGGLLLVFLVALLDSDFESSGGTPSILFSAILFTFAFVGSVFFGATFLAFKSDKQNLELPSMSSSPFNRKTLWQFEFMSRLVCLVVGVSLLLRRSWIEASIFLSLAAGFYFSALFLRHINRGLLNHCAEQGVPAKSDRTGG